MLRIDYTKTGKKSIMAQTAIFFVIRHFNPQAIQDNSLIKAIETGAKLQQQKILAQHLSSVSICLTFRII
jgi:hypothetical protein